MADPDFRPRQSDSIIEYQFLTIALYCLSTKQCIDSMKPKKVSSLGMAGSRGSHSAEQTQTVSMPELPTTQQKEHLCFPPGSDKILELSLVGLAWVTCLSLDLVARKVKLTHRLVRPDLCAHSWGWGTTRLRVQGEWFPEGCFQRHGARCWGGHTVNTSWCVSKDVMGNIFMILDTPAKLFCFSGS